MKQRYELTYEDARKICDRYDNFNFYERVHFINGYKACTFSYFLCNYEDFANPIKEDPFTNAFDMRGATFVFDKDQKLWKRFLMLPKFFNLNQVEETMHHAVEHKKVSNITEKEDGTLIAFMKTPDDKLFSKTIGGFDNDQCIRSMNIVKKDKALESWISNVIDIGYTPLFEYVSYDNRIVLDYKGTNLVFIGLRNNNNGAYVSGTRTLQIGLNLPENMNTIKSHSFTLDELISKASTEIYKEGWVVQFDDDQLVKIKTKWYYDKHYTRTENVFREDYIMDFYLKDKLDDVVSKLDKEFDADAIAFIENIKMAMNSYISSIDKQVYNLKHRLNYEFNGDEKRFAINCHKEPCFGLLKYVSDPIEYHRRKIEMVAKNTRKLKDARNIMKLYGKK